MLSACGRRSEAPSATPKADWRNARKRFSAILRPAELRESARLPEFAEVALARLSRTLSALLNGHAGISADMAIRLSRAFGRSPESWLQLQLQYDLWRAEQRASTIRVKQFAMPTGC
jgi:addiction module HigA family antidote